MRRHCDQIIKRISEADPRGLLDLIELLPLSAEVELTPLEREMTREPLLIDQAYLLKSESGSWIAHLEAFTGFRKDDLERLVNYAAEFFVKLRLPARIKVVLMLEAYDPGEIPSLHRVQSGGLTLELAIDVVKLWEKDATEILDKQRPYLIPLVALAKATPEDLQEASRRISQVVDPRAQAETGALLHILGGLRYGKEEWQQLAKGGLAMIRDEVLEQSYVIQEWLQRGRNEGLQAGREKGREEGTLLNLQRNIRELVAARFPDLDGQTAFVSSFPDIEILTKLFRALAAAPDAVAAQRFLQEAVSQSQSRESR